MQGNAGKGRGGGGLPLTPTGCTTQMAPGRTPNPASCRTWCTAPSPSTGSGSFRTWARSSGAGPSPGRCQANPRQCPRPHTHGHRHTHTHTHTHKLEPPPSSSPLSYGTKPMTPCPENSKAIAKATRGNHPYLRIWQRPIAAHGVKEDVVTDSDMYRTMVSSLNRTAIPSPARSPNDAPVPPPQSFWWQHWQTSALSPLSSAQALVLFPAAAEIRRSLEGGAPEQSKRAAPGFPSSSATACAGQPPGARRRRGRGGAKLCNFQ